MSALFLAIGLLAAADPAPVTTSSTEIFALIPSVERAVRISDADELARLRETVADSGAGETSYHDAREYLLAYLTWRLHVLRDAKEGQRLLVQAQKILEELSKREPDNAETLALLGTVYGSRITGTLSGIRLGSRVNRVLEQAGALSPDNPRVLLQQGISAIFTPESFGGGLETATQKLRRAEALFADEPDDAPWPDWGRVDVYAWLGQVLAKQNDIAGARAAYEQGLGIEPDNARIRDLLLPALDRVEP